MFACMLCGTVAVIARCRRPLVSLRDGDFSSGGRLNVNVTGVILPARYRTCGSPTPFAIRPMGAMESGVRSISQDSSDSAFVEGA